jgi:hypothetical protein
LQNLPFLNIILKTKNGINQYLGLLNLSIDLFVMCHPLWFPLFILWEGIGKGRDITSVHQVALLKQPQKN